MSRCWWCRNSTAQPMMIVCGPWAFQKDSEQREFCSMHCFWEWAEAMAQERVEGRGLDGRAQPDHMEKITML